MCDLAVGRGVKIRKGVALFCCEKFFTPQNLNNVWVKIEKKSGIWTCVGRLKSDEFFDYNPIVIVI